MSLANITSNQHMQTHIEYTHQTITNTLAPHGLFLRCPKPSVPTQVKPLSQCSQALRRTSNMIAISLFVIVVLIVTLTRIILLFLLLV